MDPKIVQEKIFHLWKGVRRNEFPVPAGDRTPALWNYLWSQKPRVPLPTRPARQVDESSIWIFQRGLFSQMSSSALRHSYLLLKNFTVVLFFNSLGPFSWGFKNMRDSTIVRLKPSILLDGRRVWYPRPRRSDWAPSCSWTLRTGSS